MHTVTLTHCILAKSILFGRLKFFVKKIVEAEKFVVTFKPFGTVPFYTATKVSLGSALRGRCFAKYVNIASIILSG